MYMLPLESFCSSSILEPTQELENKVADRNTNSNKNVKEVLIIFYSMQKSPKILITPKRINNSMHYNLCTFINALKIKIINNNLQKKTPYKTGTHTEKG